MVKTATIRNFCHKPTITNMPFDRASLAAMVVEDDEYVNKEQIAERLGVTPRTVERLIEANTKTLKKYRRRKGRKVIYLWSEVLRCAKIHVGIEKVNGPSLSMKRACTKQRILELEDEVKRLREFQAIQYGDIVVLRQILSQKTGNKNE